VSVVVLCLRCLIIRAQKEAVERFADWLITLTVEKEVANGTGGGAGKAKIVLCGHRCANRLSIVCVLTVLFPSLSMGGLLAADTLLAIVNNRVDKQAPVWPKIVACIAFDTPVWIFHPDSTFTS
jgi:hypothetical protein